MLTLVKARALQHEADTSAPLSPAAALHLLLRLQELHSEWELLEQQRASLLQRHSHGSQLQLSIIPHSPFPSPAVVASITSSVLSSLSTALPSHLDSHSQPPSTSSLPCLLDQWTPVLHTLTRLHQQQRTAVRRLCTTAQPLPHLCADLPGLMPLIQPLPLPSHQHVLAIINHSVRSSLCASPPSTPLSSLTSTAHALHQQLTAALLPWMERLELPLFPASHSPSQSLADVVRWTSAPLTPGGAVIHLPCSLSLAEAGKEAPSSPAEATLGRRPQLCEEERFLLYQQGELYAHTSALRQAMATATHRPPPASDSREPIVSGYVPLLRRLLLALPPLPPCPFPSLRHYHTTVASLLTQYTHRSVGQQCSLQGGQLGPALLLHSDLSHVIDAWEQHGMEGCDTLSAARTRLASACVEHSVGWLVEQQGVGFGPELKRFPLVLPFYPVALPTDDVTQLLHSSPSPIPLQVSPYLSLYLHWLVPLQHLLQRLHPATQSILPGLLDALHASLFTFLSSLLHTPARVNANGATLLTREVMAIHRHASVEAEQSGDGVDAEVVRLRAALHVLTHAELYRAALPGKRGAGAATVAPMPPPDVADTGVRLPGHCLAEWKDWLGLASRKHHRAWEAAVQRDAELPELKEAEPLGCAWWRSNRVAAAPVPASGAR